MEHAIVADGLVKRYRGLTAVDGVSFSVAPGEVFAVLGPNGAGKTTTVEILEGFRRPDGGRAFVLQADPARADRSRIGVMLQEPALQSGIRTSEALKLFASFYDRTVPRAELVERLGLGRVLRTPWRRLSGGERKRLSLALAVIGRPDVLFLDEPTAGMDPHGRVAAWKLIDELRDGGTAVLLTTHLLEEAERAAGRVAILHRGRILACGNPRDLAASAPEIRFRARASLDVSSFTSAVVEEEPGTYRVAGANPQLVAELAAWLAGRGVLIEELTTGGASLEEVFLRLTDEEQP